MLKRIVMIHHYDYYYHFINQRAIKEWKGRDEFGQCFALGGGGREGGGDKLEEEEEFGLQLCQQLVGRKGRSRFSVAFSLPTKRKLEKAKSGDKGEARKRRIQRRTEALNCRGRRDCWLFAQRKRRAAGEKAR